MALTVYYCGINTVVVLAAIYAQEVMGFRTNDIIVLVMVVNVTAAVGAFLFGRVQDRLGSLPTLAITLLIWIGASSLAFWTESRAGFWVVANLVGIALGSSQASGRALVGQLAPRAGPLSFLGCGDGRQARSDRRAAKLWTDHLPDRRPSAVGHVVHCGVLCGWTYAVRYGQ